MNFEEIKKKNLTTGTIINIRYLGEIFIIRTFIGGPFKGNAATGDYIIVRNGEVEEQIQLDQIESLG